MSTRTFYGFGETKPVQKTITGAYTISEADHGVELVLNAAAGAALTLPSPKPGFKVDIVVGAAFATTNWTVVTASSANIINGSVEVAGAVVVGGAEDTISFVATAETIGDRVHLSTDGTSWFVSGSAALSGGITLTQASA